MLTFCLIIILLSIISSVATSKSVIKLTDTDRLNDFHLGNIFYLSEAGDLLFIDFDVIKEKLEKVNVIKDRMIVVEENVTDLPADMIYELDLSVFRSGTYTVELVTNNTTLRKEVAIN